MANLSEKVHTSKTIVYLIQINQTDFEIPCNIIAPNTCIITLFLSYHIVNIMHIKNIFNRHYIVCYIKIQIHSDIDCTNQSLDLIQMKHIDFFKGNLIYNHPFWNWRHIKLFGLNVLLITLWHKVLQWITPRRINSFYIRIGHLLWCWYFWSYHIWYQFFHHCFQTAIPGQVYR